MSKEKSIVIITSYDGPYGGNFIASLKFLDKRIKTEGYRTVYIFQEKVKDFSWIQNVNSFADKVYFLPYKPNSIDNTKRIRKILFEENAVIIYSRMSGWDIDAHLASTKIPIIWHMEMNPNLSSLSKRVKYYGKYRIIGRRNVYSVAVSKPGAETLNSLKLNNLCIAIENAADFSRLLPVNRDNQNIKIPNFLIFAYDPYVKGLDLALDAFEIINKDSIRCNLLVSAQKLTYDYLENRYNGDMPEWIKVLEPVDDISKVYGQSYALISSSRSEGFSFSVIEAIYSGLPIIYSDIPGTIWVDEMKSVYKFRSGDVGDLVLAIKNCLENRITDANRDYNISLVKSKYSLDGWADKFINLIKEITEK